MRFPAMPRAVPWVFLALVVLTLSAVTAWPWRSTRTTRPSSRSSSRPSTTTSSSPPVAQEQPDGSLLLPWRTKPGPNAHFHKVNRMSFCVVFDTFRYMSHPTRTVMPVFQCFHASERGQTRLSPGCLGFEQVFLHIHACITPRVSCRRDLADGVARRLPLCAGQEALANDHQEVRRGDRGRVG